MALTQDQFNSIAAAYNEGATLAELAAKFQVSIPTMSKYVVKGGGTLRPRGQRPRTATPVVSTPAPVVEEQPLPVAAAAPARQILSLE